MASTSNQFTGLYHNGNTKGSRSSSDNTNPASDSMKVSLDSLLSSNPLNESNNRVGGLCNNSSTNTLEAVLSNSFDFDECSQNPPSISPLLNFSGPSPLSKDDEDSLDRRLREFENGTSNSNSDMLDRQSNNRSVSLVNELPSDNSLLAPSPQSLGVPASVDRIGSLGQNLNLTRESVIGSSNSNSVSEIMPSISSSGVLISSNSLLSNTPNVLRTGLTRPCDTGEAEAVSRISAMLQQEAEAITASNFRDSRPSGSQVNTSSNSLPTHILDSQGISSRNTVSSAGHLNRVVSNISDHQSMSNGLQQPLNVETKTSNISLSSVNPAAGSRQRTASNQSGNISGCPAPVPIQMSVETLNQIQADLLATVSESDLNAVLNATPDSSDPVVLSNNNPEVFFPNNATVQFTETSFLNSNSDNFDQQPLSNRSSSSQPQSFPLDSVSETLPSSQTPTLDSLLRDSRSSNSDKLSQSEELKNAVNSITNLNSSFDSQLSSFLPGVNQSHVVASPVPSPSPSLTPVNLPTASPMGSLQANANLHEVTAIGQSPVTSQGITVVIGGTGTPINLPHSSPISVNKGNGGSTVLNQRLVPQNIVVSTASVQKSPATTPSTPTHSNLQTVVSSSPKKSSKKKKPGEQRKIVPLKDREYNADIHCGVIVSETGKPCTRSLTCKTHSLTLRRAVNSRSKKFDELLFDHKANKEASNKAAKALESGTGIQVSY